jgi:hypothetical protein
MMRFFGFVPLVGKSRFLPPVGMTKLRRWNDKSLGKVAGMTKLGSWTAVVVLESRLWHFL